MADPNWELIAGAVAAQDMIKRAFGPTADYYGGALKSLQEKGWSNASKVFAKMVSKIGDKIDDGAQVPPKVFRDFINDAPFVDDELAADYFGGVLASSRTSSARDDRGAVFTALLSRMSTYQIRAHYIIYRSLNQLYAGEELSVLMQHDAVEMSTLFDLGGFMRNMDFDSEERRRFNSISSHILNGLDREGLIGPEMRFGNAAFMRERYPKTPNLEWSMVIRPEVFGVELFNWAHGMRDAEIAGFTTCEYPELEAMPGLVVSAIKARELK